MGFGDLKSAAGLSALNNFLADRSYIDGYTPSQADVAVFQAMSGAPSADLFHALRWYNQVKSYSKEFASLTGIKKPVDQYGPAGGAAPAPTENGAGGGDDDDDFDLFGSDDDADEVEKLKEERKAATEEKKKPKKVVIAKSSIVLDIKPWDDETDLGVLEKHVRTIVMDGLLWGASKLVPIAFGIKKLQISCVVEDDKISTEDLEDNITAFEDFVQSVDIVAFNKI